MKRNNKQTHKYSALFEVNEHCGYTVTVPSLPGLVTEGKNLEHARSMAKDAVRCYIEGLKKAKEPIPLERGNCAGQDFRRRLEILHSPHPRGARMGHPAFTAKVSYRARRSG
jgi:predicted RNase H-like HicB family nuclease